MAVAVGAEASPPDPSLTKGVCPEGYILCPDQSMQTEIVATLDTKVNVPWLEPLAADALKLSGIRTRASTPWNKWRFRKLEGKVCRQRAQNPTTQ